MKSRMLLTAVFFAAPAVSQDMVYVDTPVQGRENVSYAYADVLRAVPTYEILQVSEAKEECAERTVPEALPLASTHAEVANGHDGAQTLVVASERTAADASLPMRDCRLVNVVREERRINGYDVEYRYKGLSYMSRMDYDPGNKLRIRVTVAPAD